MNERIRELAHKAGLEWGPGGYADYSDFDHSLFAELIVRECAEIARVFSVEGVEYDGGDAIREHFGVEP
jgi:hypothetical protein